MQPSSASHAEQSIDALMSTFDYPQNAYSFPSSVPFSSPSSSSQQYPTATMATSLLPSAIPFQSFSVPQSLPYSLYSSPSSDSHHTQPQALPYAPPVKLEDDDSSQSSTSEAYSADIQSPKPKRKRENRYKNASPAVISRRRAQNRASQRAYRERKDQRIRGLEEELQKSQDRVAQLEHAVKTLQQQQYVQAAESSAANTHPFPSQMTAAVPVPMSLGMSPQRQRSSMQFSGVVQQQRQQQQQPQQQQQQQQQEQQQQQQQQAQQQNIAPLQGPLTPMSMTMQTPSPNLNLADGWGLTIPPY